MAASASRDLGEVVFLCFSSASAHRQVGAPSAALCFGLLLFAPLFSTFGGFVRAHLCNLCSEGHRAEIMQGFPQTCVFQRSPEQRGRWDYICKEQRGAGCWFWYLKVVVWVPGSLCLSIQGSTCPPSHHPGHKDASSPDFVVEIPVRRGKKVWILLPV